MIKEFVKNKIIPDNGLTPDDIIWAAAIWKQMADYRQKSEKLLADLGKAKLADDKKALYEQAKSYYDKFNYLDAFRLATAASS
jgi:hypothetical protein